MKDLEIKKDEKSDFVPTHFLTIYSRKGSSFEKYLEIGEIKQGENGFEIGPAIPNDMDFLTDLVDCIKVENFKALKWKELIPSNVIYCNSENQNPVIIWYQTATKKQLFFDSNMGIETAIFDLPPLLFACKGNELKIFRLIEVPNINSELFMVPLPNIHDDSKVCLGNNKPKKAKNLEQHIANLEDVFYKTRFNALHHTQFGDDVIYVDVMKENNLNLFPLVLSEQTTVKKLIYELS
jgi:PRTRC genetic system protein B